MEKEGERNGGKEEALIWREAVPENIGHWPIFIEEKKRFAECKNSTADFNIFF